MRYSLPSLFFTLNLLGLCLLLIQGEQQKNENRIRVNQRFGNYSYTMTVPVSFPLQFIESKVSTTPVKLAIVSSIGLNDMNHFIESMKSYRNTSVKFILNCFERNETCNQIDLSLRTAALEPLIHHRSRLSGAKIYFWKTILTSAVIESFDYLWLIDADVAFSYHDYPITKLISVSRALNTSILHPTIPGSGGRMTKHHHHHNIPPIKPVCSLDILGSLYTTRAYQLLDSLGLQHVDDDTLMKSSWGIFGFVCDLLTVYPPHAQSFPCLQISLFPLMHLDSQTMPNREKRAAVMPVWEQRRRDLGIAGKCVSQLHLQERRLTNLVKSSQVSEISLINLN